MPSDKLSKRIIHLESIDMFSCFKFHKTCHDFYSVYKCYPTVFIDEEVSIRLYRCFKNQELRSSNPPCKILIRQSIIDAITSINLKFRLK